VKNKLTRYKNKFLICSVLLCCFVLGSCRKDAVSPKNSQTAITDGQLIKQEAILKLLASRPATNLLTLDWKNARQAKIDGKSVVRIPTLDVDKSSILYTDEVLKLNSLNSSITVATGSTDRTTNPANTQNSKSTNYYSQHPPEVFIIQAENTARLSTYLLNFVPTDPNKEFGQDGVWTGKLYEWNLTGDTIFVQDISKSKLKEKYAVKAGGADAKNTKGALMSLNDKKRSNFMSDFFDWLGGLFSDIWQGINYVGYYLGIPGAWTADPNNSNSILIRTWGWETGGGGGGGGSYSAGTYVGAGFTIYYEHIDGYGTPDGGEVNWTPMPTDPGSTGGPNPNSMTTSLSGDYLADNLMLTIKQAEFIRQLYNTNSADALVSYLGMYGEITSEKKAFAEWAIGYLYENRFTLNFDDFDNQIVTRYDVAQAFAQYIATNNIFELDNKNFLDWAARYLTTNPTVATAVGNFLNLNQNLGQIAMWSLLDIRSGTTTWGQFETLAVLFQNQNYVPRDNEPTSYNWRNLLTSNTIGNYLTIPEPWEIKDNNGNDIPNPAVFNCHYHSFGPNYILATRPGYPKYVENVDLTKFNKVTGNIQVGDIVLYFVPNPSKVGVGIQHSAVVTEVDVNGYATKVSSKMGIYQILEHHPRDIPTDYGVNASTFTIDIPATPNIPASTKTYPSRIYFRKK
jgi:hypothetical protein